MSPEGAEAKIMDDTKCCHCGISDDERNLKKCVMCFRRYCEECEHDRNGRSFCSKACSLMFFFGDDD